MYASMQYKQGCVCKYVYEVCVSKHVYVSMCKQVCSSVSKYGEVTGV